MKNLLIASLSLFCFCKSFAQQLNPITNIEVFDGNRQLAFPFAGGQAIPQPMIIDINQDGFNDMVLYDKGDNSFNTFIHSTEDGVATYNYQPEYAEHFPTDIRGFALLKDLNCDGIPDLFTYSTFPTLEVIIGELEDGEVSFTVNARQPIMYNNQQSGSTDTDISFVNNGDNPIIEDEDNDGDLDVMAFDPNGGTAMFKYTNLAAQQGDGCGWIPGPVKSCWGAFFESAVDSTIIFKEGCRAKRHSGSTPFAYDFDEDGDFDMLLGDAGSSTVTLLHNTSTADSALFTSADYSFPNYDVPVHVDYAVATYGGDIDNDGDDDLLFSPFTTALNVDAFNNLLMYKNEGAAPSQLRFRTSSFIVGDMIDFGTASTARFIDFNQDGLMDIIVAVGGGFMNLEPLERKMWLLENKGPASYPVFEIVNKDFANIARLDVDSFSPTFGDLDGDGDFDLVFGDLNGNVHFVRNDNGNYVLSQANMSGIDVGQLSQPTLYDLNQDGLLDLIIGTKNGDIQYFENTGDATNFSFSASPTVQQLGGNRLLSTRVVNVSPSFYQKNGNTIMAAGTFNKGIIEYIVDANDPVNGVYDSIGPIENLPKANNYTLDVADLNQDGINEFLIGNRRGGAFILSEEDWDTARIISSISVPNSIGEINLYPNPASETLHFTSNQTRNIRSIHAVNVLGERLPVTYRISGKDVEMNISSLPKGMYILHLQLNGATQTERFIKQ